MHDIYGNGMNWSNDNSKEFWVENELKKREAIEVMSRGIFYLNVIKTGKYLIRGTDLEEFPFEIKPSQMDLHISKFKITPVKEVYKGGEQIEIEIEPYDSFENKCEILGLEIIIDGNYQIAQRGKVVLKLNYLTDGKRSILAKIGNTNKKITEIFTEITSPSTTQR